MSGMLSRIRFLFLASVGVISTAIGAASAAWYFFNDPSNVQSGVKDIGDPIRPNQTFGDAEDQEIDNRTYYDVYFLAQNVQDVKSTNFLVETSPGSGNYVFKNGFDGEFHYESGFTSDEGIDFNKHRFWGDFAEPSGDPIYYKRFENVAEITFEMLDEVGYPHCTLVDGNSKETEDKYFLEFADWAADPYPIYERDNETNGWLDRYKHFANSECVQVYGTYPYEGCEIAYFNILLDYYSTRAITIDGQPTLFFYPIYTVGKDYSISQTQGTGVEELRDMVDLNMPSDENGPSLFIYDSVYSKAYNDKNPAGNDEKAHNNQYRIYTFSNLHVKNAATANSPDDDKITVNVHMDAYDGGWPGDGGSNTLQKGSDDIVLNYEEGRYNIYLLVKEKYDSTTLFDSDIDPNDLSPDFVTEELVDFYEVLSADEIIVYKTYKANTSSYNHQRLGRKHCDTRAYYLAIERLYEPHYIGGATGDLDYDSPKAHGFHFTQSDIRGVEANSFDLRGLDFNVDDFGYIRYEVNVPGVSNRILMIPDYYFAVQVDSDKKLMYGQNIINDTTASAESVGYPIPHYEYRDSDGNEQTEPYLSSSLLISVQDAVDSDVNAAVNEEIYKDIDRIRVTKKTVEYNESGNPIFYTLREYKENYDKEENENIDIDKREFSDLESLKESLLLVRPKESGTYNIYAHINYDMNDALYETETGTGGTEPSPKYSLGKPASVDLWAYRLHNTFVNIYDPRDFGNKELTFDGNVMSKAFLNANYSFRCSTYYHLGADIMYGDDGVRPKEFLISSNAAHSLSNMQTNGNGQYDIKTILTQYDEEGRCLQDIVTGRYITLGNYATNPFIIQKNHVLQVVAKPSQQ